jgi:hypothetical protein
MFITMARSVWHPRKSVIHGGPFTHPKFVAQEAGSLVEQFWRNSLKKEEDETSTPKLAVSHMETSTKRLF